MKKKTQFIFIHSLEMILLFLGIILFCIENQKYSHLWQQTKKWSMDLEADQNQFGFLNQEKLDQIR